MSTNGASTNGARPLLSSRMTLQNGLRRNIPMFGPFMMLSSAWTARIVAEVGWDFVIVDCEHGNIGDNDMHDSVNAVAACGVSPIVRIRGTDPTLIKRALDCGAHGLMIPMIHNAEQARGVVEASKFPPLGARGQGSPFSASALGMKTAEYLKNANDTLLTIVQIESLEGLKNVEEICKVPGVDVIFIGPNDLAMAMLGYAPANYTEKLFLEALDHIQSTAKKCGIQCGILCADGVKAKAVRGKFDMIAIGGDVKALQGWMTTNLDEARA